MIFDLFMRGDFNRLSGPKWEEPPPLNEVRHPLTAGLIFVDNKRNKSDNGAEYFICYPYPLWENDTEM